MADSRLLTVINTDSPFIAAVKKLAAQKDQISEKVVSDTLQEVLEHSKSINKRTEDTQQLTPLILAVMLEDQRVVQWLLEKHKYFVFLTADPEIDAEDSVGKTALMHAINYADAGLNPTQMEQLGLSAAEQNAIEVRRNIVGFLMAKKASLKSSKHHAALLATKAQNNWFLQKYIQPQLTENPDPSFLQDVYYFNGTFQAGHLLLASADNAESQLFWSTAVLDVLKPSPKKYGINVRDFYHQLTTINFKISPNIFSLAVTLNNLSLLDSKLICFSPFLTETFSDLALCTQYCQNVTQAILAAENNPEILKAFLQFFENNRPDRNSLFLGNLIIYVVNEADNLEENFSKFDKFLALCNTVNFNFATVFEDLFIRYIRPVLINELEIILNHLSAEFDFDFNKPKIITKVKQFAITEKLSDLEKLLNIICKFDNKFLSVYIEKILPEAPETKKVVDKIQTQLSLQFDMYNPNQFTSSLGFSVRPSFASSSTSFFGSGSSGGEAKSDNPDQNQLVALESMFDNAFRLAASLQSNTNPETRSKLENILNNVRDNAISFSPQYKPKY